LFAVRQPQRRLVAAASVVEGDEPTWKLAARLDPLQSVWDVLAKEEPRAERAGLIAAHEQIDVADVIGLDNDDGGRGTRVEPLQNSAAFSGGASGSRTSVSPRDSTQVDATIGSQPCPGFQ